MRVFISWSGPLSRQIALILREWLPQVIQAIDPWVSAEDIEKGARWSSEIAQQLQDTKAGVICVTPGNQEAAWLNFEAGALSKAVDASRVCTYLFRMVLSDLIGPLTQFQATEATKDDTRKLVGTLNKGLGAQALSDNKLNMSFDIWWEKLESQLAQISAGVNTNQPKRGLEDMVQEVLSLAREQAKSIEEVKMRQHLSEAHQLERQQEASRWASYDSFRGSSNIGGQLYTYYRFG